jgi:hypothetical protein
MVPENLTVHGYVLLAKIFDQKTAQERKFYALE